MADIAKQNDAVDHAILDLLLHSRGAYPAWAVEEVAREIGDPLAAEDALARLHRTGLVHRLGSFVFATRAAIRGFELVQ